MGKAAKTVKWSIGADEPEDLQDFLSNDDIILKNTPRKGANKGETQWPGKGPFTFRVQFVRKAEIQGGDNKGKPRLRVMLVLDDKSTPDWNGYAVFDGFNVTEQGKSFLKRWLRALGIEWKDFYNKTKEQEDGDKIEIIRIGSVNFKAAKPVTLRATVKVMPADDYNDDEHLEIGRYLPVEDEEPDDDGEEDEDEVEVDEDEDDGIEVEDDDDDDDSDEDDEDEDEDEEDDEDEDEEDEEDEDEDAYDRDDLKAMPIGDLRELAAEWGVKKKKIAAAGKKKSVLVDLVATEMNLPPF